MSSQVTIAKPGLRPEAVRAARHAAGASQEQLARAPGISAATVARVERGTVQPTRGTLRLLELALADIEHGQG
jgi:transcriptional regulator with XRE-family HTH domain